jgi:predicted RNase H-like HicB family nuclease
VHGGELWIREMSVHSYLVLFKEDSNRISAQCLDLPGCTAEGATFEEAKQHIIEAMRIGVQRLKDSNLPVPDSLEWEDYVYGWPELSAPGQTAMGILFGI